MNEKVIDLSCNLQYLDNKYYCNNPNYFNQVKKIVIDHPKLFGRILHDTGQYTGNNKNRPDRDKRYLLNWINSQVPLLNSNDYSLGTKLYWIFNNLSDFPVCPTCGKTENYKKMYKINVFDGYPLACTNKYRQKLPQVREKVILTTMDHYGVSCSWQAEEVKELCRQKHIENYGVEVPSKSPIIVERTRKVCMEKYGVKNGGCSKQALEKIKQTNNSRRGVDWVFQDPLIQKQIENIIFEKYGQKSYFSTKEFKDVCRQMCLEQYGVKYFIQVPEIRSRISKKYCYDSIQFDSAPEVALYIWLTENNIDFEYQPSMSFEYYYQNKKHFYFPDFRIEGYLYEIKGDIFFKDQDIKKEMICPYRKRERTDDRYQKECDRYETKHQCMKSNNIIILTSKDYKFYVEYVRSKYGNQFFKSLKQK